MKSFTDTKSRTWDITLNYSTLCKLRDAKLPSPDGDPKKTKGVDLLNNVALDLPRVFDDTPLFYSILFTICKDQADKYEVKDVAELGDSISGEVHDQAWNAFCEELRFSSPDHKRIQIDKIIEMVGVTMTELKQKSVQSMMSSLNGQVPLGSIPDHTQSGS